MKKYVALALVLVLTLGVLTGCRRKQPEASTTVPTTMAPTTMPTVAPTTRPTTAPTTAPSTMPTTGTDMGPGMMPGMDDMVPGPEDTIDPTNGANDSTTATGARGRNLPRN